MNDANQPAANEPYGPVSADQSLRGTIARALLRGLVLALPLGIVLAGIVAGILYLVVEPEYQSSATLAILEKRPYLVFPEIEDYASRNYVETQLELLREPYIIERAVETDSLLELPELRAIRGEGDVNPWIASRLTVARVGKSELFKVTFDARHPESAQKILAAIVRTYKKFEEAQSDSHRRRMLELLQDERIVREGDVDRKRKTLLELSKLAVVRDNPGFEPAANEPALQGGATPLTLLAGLEQRAIHAEIETGLFRDRVDALRAEQALPIRVSDNQLTAALAQEPGIVQLTRELKLAQRKLDSDTSTNPSETATLQEVIVAKEQELETRKTDIRPILKEEIEARRSLELREALNLAENRLENETKTLDSLRERIGVERRTRQRPGDQSLEIAFARDELNRAEEVGRLINDRIVQLNTESRALSQVKIVADPTMPQFPSEPPAVKNPFIAGAVAFLAPFVVCLPLAVATALVRRRKQPQSGRIGNV